MSIGGIIEQNPGSCEPGEFNRVLNELLPLGDGCIAMAIYRSHGRLDEEYKARLQNTAEVIAFPEGDPTRVVNAAGYYTYIETMLNLIPAEDGDTLDQAIERIKATITNVTDILKRITVDGEVSEEDTEAADTFLSSATELSYRGFSFGKTTTYYAVD